MATKKTRRELLDTYLAHFVNVSNRDLADFRIRISKAEQPGEMREALRWHVFGAFRSDSALEYALTAQRQLAEGKTLAQVVDNLRRELVRLAGAYQSNSGGHGLDHQAQTQSLALFVDDLAKWVKDENL